MKEPFQKTNFVRLISPHDSMYLMLVFTCVVQILSIMDAFAENWAHFINLVYIPMLMYMIVKMMDTKQAKLVNSFFPFVAFLITIAGIYIHLTAHVVTS